MVRGVAEQALGVGVEFDIGAGDSEKDFPVIESPSENHKNIFICKMIVNCLAFSRERLRSVLSNVLLSTSISRSHFQRYCYLERGWND